MQDLNDIREYTMNGCQHVDRPDKTRTPWAEAFHCVRLRLILAAAKSLGNERENEL